MLMINIKISVEIKFSLSFLLLKHTTMCFKVIKIVITCRNVFIRALTETQLKLISINTLELNK